MIKTKMFYSHLVDLSDLVVKLECLKLDEQEREEIVSPERPFPWPFDSGRADSKSFRRGKAEVRNGH